MASPASSAPRSSEPSADNASHSGAPKVTGELIAVTTRDDFLLELGEVLTGQLMLSPVDHVAAALEQLAAARRPQVLAIDSRISNELRPEIDRLHAQAPSVPVLVFTLAESDKAMAAAMKGASIFAVLPIPVDRRKTVAVLEGALAEAVQRRSASRAAAAAAPGTAAAAPTAPAAPAEHRFELRAPLVPEPATTVTDTDVLEGGSRRPPLLVIGAVAAVIAVLIGLGAWLLLRSPSTPQAVEQQIAPAASAPAATAPAAGASHSVRKAAQATPEPLVRPSMGDVPLIKGNADDLLEKARQAMRERRFTEPATDNALLYYRSALAVDGGNAEARDGMARLGALLLSRFEEAYAGARYEEAAGALAGLKLALSGDSRLAPMESRLIAAEVTHDLNGGDLERVPALLHQAQQDGAATAEQLTRWRAELARHQDDARVKHLSELVAERIRDGHLDEPDTDSARYYLQQLKGLEGADAAFARSTHDLIVAYLHRARDATLANHPSDADRWQGAARAAGATPADLSTYQHELVTARQRATGAEIDRLAQLARERLRDGHLTEPTQDSAAFYLGQLRDSYPDSSALGSLGHELAAQLVERAMSSARAGLPAQMEADLSLARRWGADPAQLQAVEQTMAGNHGGAVPTHAAPAAPSGPTPKRTRYIAPEYPDDALDKRISGSVTIEFTVDEKGVPRNVHVTDSRPKGIFDRAAMNAVIRWRFEPLLIDGVPTAVPAHETIRFEAPSN
ncbi:MAG TPA: TonB family protein [Steroidobacteraceae bacterium]|nr:TonB family protein [Steroidobacteraceae bacterium]